MEDKYDQIPKFTGSNFGVWKIRVESLLAAKGLSDVIKTLRPKSTAPDAQEAYDKKDTKVKAIIISALDDNHVQLVLQCKSSREIWSRLTAIHDQKSAACKNLLQKEFFDISKQEDESVSEYISRAEKIFGQLQDIGLRSIDSDALVSRIVTGLPEQYMAFMSRWSSEDSHRQTLNELLPQLMAEEKLIQQFTKGKGGLALMGEGSRGNSYGRRYKPPYSYRNNQSSHNTYSQDHKNSTYRNFSKKNNSVNNNKNTNEANSNQEKRIPARYRCYICKVKGHLNKDCPSRKSKRVYEATAIVAESHYSRSVYNKPDGWILDSGSTNHMSYNSSLFSSYKHLEVPRTVQLGDGNVGYAIGEGEVTLQTVIEPGVYRSVIAKDVWHVPEVKRNLISQSNMMKKNIIGDIKTDRVIMRDTDGKPIFSAFMRGDLLHLWLKNNEEEFAEANLTVIDKETELDLWHRRLAHNNFINVENMSKFGSVKGLPNLVGALQKSGTSIQTIKCISCKLGKQPRKHFPRRSQPRATVVGERLHIDMCGPIPVATIAGAKHFVLLKDEYSNYKFIYFVKTKDNLFEALDKTIAEIQSRGFKVKTLVSDRGSELTSNRTKELLNRKDILHELSAPFTPEQNGFIERENRTIAEAARTMLIHKDLPAYLWGEAANTAVYIYNRIINKNTEPKTPFELYYGCVPRIDHIRVFGSIAMVKAQEKKRSGYQSKLEPRANKCILVGFEKDYTYKCFNPVDKKMMVTRDVHFDEMKPFDWLKDKKHESDYSQLTSFIMNLSSDDECDSDPPASDKGEEPDILNDSFQSAADELDDQTSTHEEVVNDEQEEQNIAQVTLRRSARLRDKSTNAESAQVLFACNEEPSSYEEAVNSEKKHCGKPQ